jgi:hypothetical protein
VSEGRDTHVRRIQAGPEERLDIREDPRAVVVREALCGGRHHVRHAHHLYARQPGQHPGMPLGNPSGADHSHSCPGHAALPGRRLAFAALDFSGTAEPKRGRSAQPCDIQL